MINISMQKHIKQEYEKGDKSLRKISEETGLSFETVQKYAHKENWNEEKIMPNKHDIHEK